MAGSEVLSYEYYVGNSQLNINYTLSETKPTLVFYETDTASLSSQFMIGNNINYSSTTNTIFPPSDADELGIKVLSNEDYLLR